MKLVVLIFSSILFSSCANIKNDWEFSNQRSGETKKSNYLPWTKAKIEIESRCKEIIGIYQGHSRVVSVSFKDKTRFSTISPKIDQVLSIVYECNDNPEEITIIME